MNNHRSPKSLEGQQVLLAIHKRIEQGDYPPGVWLPAERALADEFGVDRSVVRAALIRLAQQGIIVREPGRRPWVRAEGVQAPPQPEAPLSPSALRTIAVVLPQHPIYHAATRILHGIHLELRTEEAPFRLLIFDTHGETTAISVEMETKALQSIEQENVSGAILWHMGGAETLPRLQQLQERDVPVVFVDRHPPEMICDFVGVDNRVAAVEAVNYLLNLKHRRIAHLTTTEQTSAVLERRAGYLEALRSAGILPRPEWIFVAAEGTSPDIGPAVDYIFGQAEPPTALFAMNDALAHYFIVEAEARGYPAPEAISVIGFDDLEHYSPRPALLTTLHQPFDQMGRRAVRLLMRRLASTAAASLPRQHLLLPTPLVVRSTCSPPPEQRSGDGV